jgi:cytochrome oxidase Cu insertion factor (SCO1/SenC/PrrC family)
MAKVTEALNTMKPELSEQVVPIFISVDTKRDSLELINLYLKGKKNH